MTLRYCFNKINQLELMLKDSEDLFQQKCDEQAQQIIDDLNKNDRIIELETSLKESEGQVKSLKRRNSYLSDKIEIQETKKNKLDMSTQTTDMYRKENNFT